MNIIPRSVVVLISLLLVILASWSFFGAEFFRVHDYTHVARTVEMSRAIQAGQFPVHWSQNFGYGYGMPLFLFYGPLPFYLSGGLNLLGLSALNAVKVVFLLAQVLAFVGMYKLMSRWGRSTGLLAATAFLWAPYRAVDIYVRGALNEVFALSLLPWILHFSLLFTHKPRQAWLGTSMTVAALVITHNLTALFSLPILFLFSSVAVLLQARKKLQSWLLLFSSYVVGSILSAFYALPLWFEKNFTIVDQITGGYFDYHLHFLYIRQFLTAVWGYEGSNYGPDDGISFHLGRVMIVLAGLAILGAIIRLFIQRTNRKSWLVIMAAGGLGLGLFFTLFKSQTIWDTVPFLSYIQFPWRFLTLAVFFLSMLVGWSVSYWRGFGWRWIGAAVAMVLIVITQFSYHRPEKFLQNNDDFYYTDPTRIQTQMSDILNDYLPRTFDRKLKPISSEQRIQIFGHDYNPRADQSPRWELNRPHELYVETTPIKDPSVVIWNIADFPGWQYTINNQLITPELMPDGRRKLETKEPIQSIGARFTATPIRQAGNLLSLFALAGWTAVAWQRGKFFPRRKQ